MATIQGTKRNDILKGTTSSDWLNGDQGNDTLLGLAGDDTLDGGAGNDQLYGGNNNDSLSDNQGNNTLNGGAGDDDLSIFYATSGNNSLSGGTGNDFLYIYESQGNNTLSGGRGNDRFEANGAWGANKFFGEDGDDSFLFYPSNVASLETQRVYGGKGSDLLEINYGSANAAITMTLDATKTNGSITAGNNKISFKSIERFNLSGTSYDDNLLGGNGNDSLYSGGGNDTMTGGAGDDVLDISYTSGKNIVNGGTGNDTFRAVYLGNDNILNGGSGDDTFWYYANYTDSPAASLTQKINGGTGSDLLEINYTYASSGITMTWDATMTNGSITAGKEKISFQNIERLKITDTYHDDNIQGSNGDDVLELRNGGNDKINGNAGNDVLLYEFAYFQGVDSGIVMDLDATTTNGSITAGTRKVSFQNIEQYLIKGGDYDDKIIGGNGDDTLSTGNAGNDTIDGGAGKDLLSYDDIDLREDSGINMSLDATTTNGSITAGTRQVSFKSIEKFLIYGTVYDDHIQGGNGDDTFYAGTDGNDRINGGKGNDVLNISFTYFPHSSGITMSLDKTTTNGLITAGKRQVSFQSIEKLNINGSHYNDNIQGGNGNDFLSGGDAGNDTLTGGKGNDSLRGEGNVTFVFNNYNEGIDTIWEFNPTEDLIQVSACGFGGRLSPGVLSSSRFTIGVAAKNSFQRFIYNDATGALYFDKDGSANAFTQVQFAQLSTGLSLSAADFMVVA